MSTDQRYDNANAILDSFQNESDRGAALVGDALVADTLEQLIRAKMISSDQVAKTLLEYPGPLSGHASRCHLAYALGWIGENMYKNIKTVHRIRNRFAHDAMTLTFQHDTITTLCNALLHPPQPPPLNSPRYMFLGTVVFLTWKLWTLADSSTRPGKGTDLEAKEAEPPHSGKTK